MTFPYESPYIQALGASPFIIGVIGSVGSLTLTLVRIPGSYIADRYGRKQIIVLMTFGVSVSYLFYALAPDWRFILIGVILSNFCLIYQPALEAITADSIPSDKRGLGFAIARVVPSIPTIASPLVAAYIVTVYDLVNGMRIVYLIVIALAMAAAMVRWLFLRETLETAEPIRLVELKSVYKESITSIIEAWRTIPRNLKILTIVVIISSFEDPIYMQFASLYVLDVVGITKFQWGIATTFWIITSLIVGIPMGKLVDIIGRRRSILLSYLIFTLTTLLFVFSKGIIDLIIVFILFGIGATMIGPAFQALITDMVPKDKRGRIMGIIGTLNIIAMVPAFTIGGLLYQFDPKTPFLFTLFIGVLILLVVTLFIKEPQRREE
jgi:MFS family permease